jgi:hypothetical protein
MKARAKARRMKKLCEVAQSSGHICNQEFPKAQMPLSDPEEASLFNLYFGYGEAAA